MEDSLCVVFTFVTGDGNVHDCVTRNWYVFVVENPYFSSLLNFTFKTLYRLQF